MEEQRNECRSILGVFSLLEIVATTNDVHYLSVSVHSWRMVMNDRKVERICGGYLYKPYGYRPDEIFLYCGAFFNKQLHQAQKTCSTSNPLKGCYISVYHILCNIFYYQYRRLLLFPSETGHLGKDIRGQGEQTFPSVHQLPVT